MFKRLLVVVTVIGFGLGAVASCPSPDEAKAQMELYQIKSLNIVSNSKASAAESDKLMKEILDYNDNMFFGCMKYFESSTPYHDCRKFITLQTGYIMFDESKQKANRARVDSLYNKYKDVCPAEYYTFKAFVKDK